MTIFSNLVKAGAVLSLAVVTVPATAESMTRGVGGAGGGPFQVRCGPGWVLTGLRLRVGSWVDGVQPLCTGTVLPDRSADFKVAQPWHGGLGGGQADIRCFPALYAVRGLTVGTGMLTDRTRGVTGIRLKCSRADASGAIVSADGRFGERKPKARFDELSCPAGEVATGIYGRSGKWLDGIGLICERKTFR